MENAVERATPAMQVAAVVISYIIEMFKKISGLFSFVTGITSVD